MKIKITYKEAIKLQKMLAAIDAQDLKTKFAIGKILKNLDSIIEEYSSELSEIQLNHAAIDDKGLLVLDEKGNFKFTPDNQRILIRLIANLKNKEVEFEPYILPFNAEIEELHPIMLIDFPYVFPKEIISKYE